MIAEIQYNSRKYKVDLSKPIDISIAIDVSKKNVNAWYIDDPKIFPVSDKNWTGSVAQGADVNFNNIHFNPHSHVTHTECVGHITEKVHSINKNLVQFFFLAEVVTVISEKIENNDFIISKKQLQHVLGNKKRDAIIVRTLPNLAEKKSMQYSNTNPIYMLKEGAEYLKEKGIKHLLIDLPSLDKEKGLLLAHNAFWNTNGKLRMDATVTEFIYVPNIVKDGTYFLNLMVAPFENDATPSKPVLYEIIK